MIVIKGKQRHHKHKIKKFFKNNKLSIFVFVVVVVLAVVGFNTPFVKSRLAMSLGDTTKFQKEEYLKQRKLAEDKYGKFVESTEKKKPKKKVAKKKKPEPKKEDPNKDKYKDYTVKSGDTLTGLAQKAGITVQELMNINHLTSKVINPGQVIKVPKEANMDSEPSSTNTTDNTSQQTSSNDSNNTNVTQNAANNYTTGTRGNYYGGGNTGAKSTTPTTPQSPSKGDSNDSQGAENTEKTSSDAGNQGGDAGDGN